MLETLQYTPGKRVGRYEIVRHLAFGGMAELYLAKVGLQGFEKQVVLKRVCPHLADCEDYVAMFLDEARVATLLDHPNIAQVHDIGFEDDTWYLAMEYVHGCNLRDLLDNVKLRGELIPLGVVIAIVKSILLGLEAAHEARGKEGEFLHVVHRDVSPTNILIGFNGNVKLIDFGIAKAIARRSRTRTGVVKGKYAYMSPEQCIGGEVDRRSDIFSTGALLFELVTGSRLLEGDNDYSIMQQLVRGQLRRASALRTECPPQLDRIIDRALARNPSERFATAKEMYRALERFEETSALATSQFDVAEAVQGLLANEPSTVRPSSWAEGSNPGADDTMRRARRPSELERPARTIQVRERTMLLPSTLRKPGPVASDEPSPGGSEDYLAIEIIIASGLTTGESVVIHVDDMRGDRDPTDREASDREATDRDPSTIADVKRAGRSWLLAAAVLVATVSVLWVASLA